MASGIEHRAATRALSIPAAVITLLASGDPALAVAAWSGTIFGIICSPDLDLPQVTISERTLVQHVGVVGWVWLVIWWPYAQVVPHRHWLSHSPIGTLIRIAYLCVIAFLLGVDIVPVLLSPAGLCFCCGLAASDILHLLMDGALYKRLRVAAKWLR